ncbi:MAG: alpha-L-fucosidase [Armatimonadetes bacterium]|nr:alpha-L-fucosidase [Armatimonadota bacterium]
MAVSEQAPYEANWESLKRYTVPQWYEDAKFGIFIHWGVYAVPAFGNEWYPRSMYQEGSAEHKHHITRYGDVKSFGYKDFIPYFKAENWDPAYWARLFRESGARYVMPVAEHHDGFPMYDCSFTEWSSAKMGPKRDIVGDLMKAVRAEGMHFCVSSHRAEHWWFMHTTLDSDVYDPRYAGLYAPAQPEKSPVSEAHLEDWLARTCEMVDKYRPEVVWFDWWIEQPVFAPYLQEFAAYYYNRGLEWGQGVAINYKNEAFPVGAAVWDIERGQLADIRPYFWQTDTSVGKKSWGYIEDEDYKSTDELVDELVDIVSKNGCMLLNIGPRPDGTIPEEQEKILQEIGQWLRVNGEAVYEARPWKIYGEGPTEITAGSFGEAKSQPFTARDIRFTARDGFLYAICLDWPGEAVTVGSLAASSGLLEGSIRNVSLLGSRARLEWEQSPEGLKIRVPSEKPCDHAFVFKIELAKA